METVDPRLESVNPLFDTLSVSIADPTTQSKSGEGSPIAKLIGEKLYLGDIGFLAELLQKRSCQISTMWIEQRLDSTLSRYLLQQISKTTPR